MMILMTIAALFMIDAIAIEIEYPACEETQTYIHNKDEQNAIN